MKKIISNVLILSLFVFVIGTTNVFASASATATAKGGEDCGDIEKKEGGKTTGAMTVTSVTINGGAPLVKGVDYTVETDASTKPKIKFTNPLAAGAIVKVTLSTIKRGNFEVTLILSDC